MKTRFVQYIEERQSTLASGLAALLIIIAGFLVFSYFSGLNKQKAPAITSTATQSAQTSQASSSSKSVAQNQNNSAPQPVQPAAPAPQANNAKPSPAPSPAAAKSTGKSATYTVVQGDSLAMIAQKYYQSADKWTVIADANKLSNPSVIHAGNVLTIPDASSPPAVAAAPQPSASGSVAAASNVKANTSYTVQSGDTLWSIAEKYYGSGFEWYRIDQGNGMLPRNMNGKPVITAGQQLKIP